VFGASRASGAALAQTAGQGSLKHPLNGGLGIQLYTLRHLIPKDLGGTLALVRKWGFTEVETGLLNKMSAGDTAAALRQAGLRAASTGASYEQCRDDLQSVVRNARALGAGFVMVAWIPHKGRFARAEAERAAQDFNGWGRTLRQSDVRFTYHVHGYEFQEGPDGTLFDLIARNTDASAVEFEMDVFWVTRGGGDPVELFQRYPGRFVLTHLKDIRKGTKLCDPTGQAPDETSVALGDGMIDWPGVLTAANAQRVAYHFIEDEHPQAEKQVPRSLEYLASLKL
ncbi:MAG: sugar phosphate isomerase/epimerase family protein, partial [bacterium]